MQTPYITIEGIKGSGKTSVFQKLCVMLKAEGVKTGILNTTHPMPPNIPLEWAAMNFPALRRFDWFNETLYAHRANWFAGRMGNSHDLILGDRSIVTSYVTRWQKWGAPENCISRVDCMERNVPPPDYVVWLYCEPQHALARIQGRPVRNYGLYDEKLHRLQQAHNAYYEIFSQSLPPRLANTRWVVINGLRNTDNIALEIFNWIATEILKINIETI
jgi:thymidylate kinase